MSEEDKIIEETNDVVVKPSDVDTKPTELNIPEEYKTKSWANQLKSIDDVFKKIDNQEKYISKGQLPHKDSSEEDINTFVQKMKNYTSTLDYSDITKDESLATTLKENGVPKFQAKSIVELLSSREQKQYSEEEFESLIKEKFKGREDDLLKAKSVLKELGEEKSNQLLSRKNEDAVEIMDILSDIGKKYGINTDNAMSKLSDKSTGSNPTNVFDPKDLDGYYKDMEKNFYNNPSATNEDKRRIMKKWGKID
jgi:hypothetical protein